MPARGVQVLQGRQPKKRVSENAQAATRAFGSHNGRLAGAPASERMGQFQTFYDAKRPVTLMGTMMIHCYSGSVTLAPADTIQAWHPSRNRRAQIFALCAISSRPGALRWPSMAARCGSMIIIPRKMPAAVCGSSSLMSPCSLCRLSHSAIASLTR